MSPILRRLLLPGLLTAAMLAVLVGLGLWQVERLAWKRDILARLDRAEAAGPVPLPFDPEPLQKVRLVGRWMDEAFAWYGAEVRETPDGPLMGARLLMPLELANGSVFLVDRGWAPMSRKAVAAPAGTVTVVGWLRPPEKPGLFSAPDAPAVRRFYTLDPQAIGAALGVAPAAPWVLVELNPGPVEGYPVPARTMPRPPNNHLGYALTWFGLAGALIAVFALYAARVMRPAPVPPLAAPRAPSRPPVAAPPKESTPMPDQDETWDIHSSTATSAAAPETATLARAPAAAAPRGGNAYARLAARFARIATIQEAGGMLGWDAAAMMPPGGAAARGDQLAVLAGLAHGLLVAPEVADDLAEAERDGAGPDPWRAANLALMRHAHTRATALPADLVEAQARANSACEKVWRQARQDSDFPLVAPHLREVLGLVREQAAALGPALGLSPYDALMDGYQRGIGAADVEPVFAAYEAFLRDALPRAEALQAARPAPLRPQGPFPAHVQEALCRRLSVAAGLEAEHSRLDRSTHPFCGGTPTDVRITTRYDEADFGQALMGVMHETGHALYERGLPAAWARQPVGEAAGMAAHESQSLLVEMQACRSDAFLGWLGRELAGVFGGDAAAYDGANLARLWRRVERGFIRVDADEMTYPAHVILRFRLEQALVAGDLAVADLPSAWNDGMRALLGVVPPDNRRGCLQDIHWYDGAFGYFPSYTLGAMAAAQLMAAARRGVPDLDEALGRGELGPLVGWLRTHVHGQGSRYGFNEMLVQATGKPLDPLDFEAHLTRRYLT